MQPTHSSRRILLPVRMWFVYTTLGLALFLNYVPTGHLPGVPDVVALVLLMMGTGGAWIASLTALEPLRPWFIAATFLFVGLAFRRLYFQQPACEPGDACARSSVLKRQRLIFWIVALVLLALLSVPWLAPLFL